MLFTANEDPKMNTFYIPVSTWPFTFLSSDFTCNVITQVTFTLYSLGAQLTGTHIEFRNCSDSFTFLTFCYVIVISICPPKINLHSIPQNNKASLLCRFSQALSGWLGTVSALPFSGLSGDVHLGHVRAVVGPLKDIHWVFPKSLLCCLGCVLTVTDLFEGEPSAQFEVQIFIKDIFVLCSVFPQPWPVSQPHSMMLPPTYFTNGMDRWWVVPGSSKHDS